MQQVTLRPWVVRVRIGGGVVGTRYGVLRRWGRRRTFATEAEAAHVAQALNARPAAVARRHYWADHATSRTAAT